MPINDDWLKKLWPWLGGAAFGALLLENHYEEKRKSLAEKADPDGCRETCQMVGEALDRWEPPFFEYEDDYTEDLFDFLVEELDQDTTIAMRRRTTRGLPDILINNQLVLELKVEPKKTERDRLIGQCCDYSVQWVTWAVVIDMPEDKVAALCELLEKKSLHYIDVIPFCESDDEDEDDGHDDSEDDED